jgi:hypothetical protein
MQATKTPQGTFEVPINGRTFEFVKWGAEEQLDTLIDLSNVIGQTASQLLAGRTGDATTAEYIQTLVKTLVTGMSTDKAMTKRLMRKLASDKVLCDGVSFRYDDFYKDDLPMAFMVMRANLLVQYGNFLTALRSMLPKAAAQPQAATAGS